MKNVTFENVSKNQERNVSFEAIERLIYWQFNYNHVLQIFCEIYGECTGNHFYNKFIGYDCNILKTLVEMSGYNRKLFIDWLIDNYDPHGRNETLVMD